MATPRKKVATKKVVKKPARSPRVRRVPVEPTMTRDVRGAAVDQLPPRYAGSPRSQRYANVMREIRADGGLVGKWVPLARFVGRSGALTVRKAILAGERPIDGELADWEIEARADGETGGSVLYAKLVKS